MNSWQVESQASHFAKLSKMFKFVSACVLLSFMKKPIPVYWSTAACFHQGFKEKGVLNYFLSNR